MSSRFSWIIYSFLSLLGCVNPNAPIKTSAGKLSQAKVDQILLDCSAPSGMAQIVGSELVIFPLTDMEVLGCVLTGLRATGETNLSSVGNQRYEVR